MGGSVNFNMTIVVDIEFVIITCLQAPVEGTFLGKTVPQPSNLRLSWTQPSAGSPREGNTRGQERASALHNSPSYGKNIQYSRDPGDRRKWCIFHLFIPRAWNPTGA